MLVLTYLPTIRLHADVVGFRFILKILARKMKLTLTLYSWSDEMLICSFNLFGTVFFYSFPFVHLQARSFFLFFSGLLYIMYKFALPRWFSNCFSENFQSTFAVHGAIIALSLKTIDIALLCSLPFPFALHEHVIACIYFHENYILVGDGLYE